MRAGRRGLAIAGVCLVAVLPATLRAQIPLGSEFQVNTYTSGSQDPTSVAFDGDDGFLVVWTSAAQDGDQGGIFGQRYDSSGSAVGGEFQINSDSTGNQRSASAAFDNPSGNFVVAWHSQQAVGGDTSNNVFARVFDSSGTALGPEFMVNTYTSYGQALASVAPLAGGGFVVVWTSRYQDGDGYSVQGQRLDGMGGRLGTEFQVNTHSTHNQTSPQVASHSGGDFVVVWESYQDGSEYGVFGQRFDSNGTPLGGEFQVNTYTPGWQELPSVAVGANGGFVVTWQSSFGQDGWDRGVFARGFDTSGAPVGPEFQVNAYTTRDQEWPRVATASGGNFVVVWTSGHDGSIYGVFARSVDPAGAPVGAEFRVNTYTTWPQLLPTIGSDGQGRFTVAWSSLEQDGSSWGAFGQRFSARLTVAIDVRPGLFPNFINPSKKSLLPVAILTTPIFDATNVDPRSIAFGPDGAADSDGSGQIQDVDGDGDDDFLLHFRIRETGIQCGHPFASLTGQTVAGEAIQGVDSIATIECP
jgi:hypothetical protein